MAETEELNNAQRLLNAFFWFCNEERTNIKDSNPEYSAADISKELSKKWSEADAEFKEKYALLAEEDKIKYEEELTSCSGRRSSRRRV